MNPAVISRLMLIFPIAFAGACAVTSEPEQQAAAEEVVVVEPMTMVALEYTPPSDDGPDSVDSQASSLEGGNSVLSLPENAEENILQSTTEELVAVVETDATIDETTEVTAAPPPATIMFHFATDSTEIDAEDLIHLSEHAAYLSAHPDATLTISGHADNRGSSEHNKQLSEKRAEAVAAALREFGAPADQLVIQSFGEDVPMADASHWDENRRVELIYEEPTRLSQR